MLLCARAEAEKQHLTRKNMQSLLKTTSILCLIFATFGTLQARHIVGGVMTYECLGGNNYAFTLKVYRDCNCTDCANFDPFALIAVYRCGGTTPCSSLGQGSFFRRIDVPLEQSRDVDAPDYPCLIPPDVCVQEGVYRFNLNLPGSAESYHVSYQRCCRNITINNIFNPESSGATYSVEITPTSQQLCNSSPEFDNFPPTVICANQPLIFDHSATDPDGDQLVYGFCTPLLGGGQITTPPAAASSCAGAYPDPACPPPYGTVAFAVPTYTSNAPMGGNPVVSIDANTGIITGTPTVQGQFVVGVCVSEFRNGVLLSRILRDFQFNVASCDPQVIAEVAADEVLGDREFVVNSCGNNTVTFDNESYLEQFIDTHRWEFLINDTTRTFSAWNPTVTFPGVGQYMGTLMLNPGTNCADTATIFVNVFPEIRADFEFAYDTCVAGPVEFTDLSTTGSCCLTGWRWDFGDTESSTLQDPFHNYRIAGALPVTLTVRDTNGCEDDLTRILNYFPVPALIVVSPSEANGCAPVSVFFDNLSFPINESYDIVWNFGDGGTSGEISPTYTYESPGTFTVSVDITSPIGCQTDTTFNNLITVRPSPVAGFSYTPERPSSLLPTVTFMDESQGAIRWFWDFDNGATSSLPSPVYTYRDTGVYEVRQIVTHASGCKDTLIRIIDILPEVRYFLPNAFTPNNDSQNDGFKGVGIMDGATGFRLSIWNRWGEMVFETSNPDDAWNGRKNNTGEEVPQGVYVVLVTYREPRGKLIEIKGFATLVR